VRELDRYYWLMIGFLGGDIVSRFLHDLAAGRVPAPGRRPGRDDGDGH
jgi:hypothetical protein